MVLTTAVLGGPYQMNGATTALAYSNYFVAVGDLVVTHTDSSGNVTSLVNGVDYTVAGTPDPVLGTYVNGATVNLATAYPNGSVLISRRTARRQASSIPDAGPFAAATIEVALDRLTLIEQEDGNHFVGYIDGPPVGTNWSGLANTYNIDDYFRFRGAQAGGSQGIINLGNPGSNIWKTFGAIAS